VLEDHLSTDRLQSILDALNADDALDGTVSFTQVLSWSTPGTVTFGDQTYVAVEVALETVI
jgi:hypothetical protein